jgi:Domain of unknown function (DUF3806)
MTHQKLSPLPETESERLESQRSFVRDHYDAASRHLYDTLEGKLDLLGAILEANWINADETWKLQSLGVAFGDALAQELKLHWILVEDEHGKDPALHDPGTTITLFPLTSISKRIEKGEQVNIRQLFDDACNTVSRLRAELPPTGPH